MDDRGHIGKCGGTRRQRGGSKEQQQGNDGTAGKGAVFQRQFNRQGIRQVLLPLNVVLDLARFRQRFFKMLRYKAC